ncbi:O-antigen ligase family protein [Clostridium sp. 19966]|uniref:O-antigen ligase family protein n=1 Tax=Clostridium sp. 19966 TaxID=2768166 RepID=UPI0028DEC51F|nr:O-antigen ligase family protein [Clostridium sp. 19966]MDT8716148.1 O-antigen ligase family protein [Clostridium sp. 19966]
MVIVLFLILIIISIIFGEIIANKNDKVRKKYFLIVIIFVSLININLNIGYSINGKIYIPSSLIIIFVYLILSINISIKNKKMRYFNEMFLVIYAIFAFQNIYLDIIDKNTYVYMLSGYILIQLLFNFFYLNQNHYNSRILYKIVISIAIFNFILSLMQVITGESLLLGGNTDITYGVNEYAVNRAVGFVGSNNGAGNFAAILFPILLYKFLEKKSFINFIALLGNVIFAIITFTRIGYLAILIEFVVFLVMGIENKKKNISRAKILFIASLFAGIVMLLFGNQLIDILFIKRGTTELSRFNQFNIVLMSIKTINPLLGMGAGQYVYYISKYYGINDIVIHSQYLNALAETGVIVFGVFIVINIYILIKATKNAKIKWIPIATFLGNLICINFNPNEYYVVNIFMYYTIMFLLIFANEKQCIE